MDEPNIDPNHHSPQMQAPSQLIANLSVWVLEQPANLDGRKYDERVQVDESQTSISMHTIGKMTSE